MKTIIITGSVGTGKTTLAKKLSKKLNYFHLDVNKLIKKNKIYDGYDRKRKCYIIDIKKLNKFLIKTINNFKSINKKAIKKIFIKNKIKGLMIDSHLSHYLPKKYVDLCIITKCDLKILQKRLKNKKYSKSKIRENLDCEIFDICFNEAKERGHKVIVISTTKTINMAQISSKV